MVYRRTKRFTRELNVLQENLKVYWRTEKFTKKKTGLTGSRREIQVIIA